MQYGLRLTADLSRKENRTSALHCMGDVKAKAEFGGFLNDSLTPEFSLTSPLSRGAGQDSNGMIVDLGGAYSTQIALQRRPGVSAGDSLANPQ